MIQSLKKQSYIKNKLTTRVNLQVREWVRVIEWISKSVNESVDKLMSLWGIKSVNEWISESVDEWMSVCEWANESVSK